ncbi:MAG: OmpA family protein, partial [Proteobacteria bacterium]|nr:OmpA family protein [Pseudomonadota bacterium]
ESLGIKGGQENPANVVPYINGDPNLQGRIGMENPMNSMSGMPPMMQNPNPNMMGGNSNPVSPQAMPFELTNTQNYSSDINPTRAVDVTNINNNYYAVYLEALANDYSKYAQLFSQKGLQSDAQLLSAKADTASSGHDVVFETENSFELPLDKKPIVAHQRQILENVKARIEVLKEIPVIMGQLQSSYDCMVIEAKNRVYSRNTVCGLAHFQALDAIESRFGSMTTATSSTNVSSSSQSSSAVEVVDVSAEVTDETSAAKEVAKSEGASHFVEHAFEYENRAVLKYDNHKSFVVYYDLGSSNLDSAAIYAINRAIAFAEENDEYKLNVLGFTDRLASRDFNKKLSQRRVDGVVDALVKRGISKNKIKPVMFGEDYNSVNTRDGVGESFNRRVVIEVDVSSTFDEDTFIMQKASEI